MLLLQAVSLLLILVYIHSVFSKQPANCLRDIEDSWPRDGILRVEIIANASENYTLTQSYKKEYGALNYQYLYGEDSLSENKTEVSTNDTSLTGEGSNSPLIIDDGGGSIIIESLEATDSNKSNYTATEVSSSLCMLLFPNRPCFSFQRSICTIKIHIDVIWWCVYWV